MTSDQSAATTEPATLTNLKAQATNLGIDFHPNIGLDTLKARIAEHSPPTQELPLVAAIAEEPVLKVIPVSKEKERQRIINEATKLVRVVVTCMNQNKKEWEGEIFTASNSVVPTQKKYVPFNAENGWHVPQIILNMMRERKCQQFKTVTNLRGDKVRKGFRIPEFSIAELPPLTSVELEALRKKQAMSAGIED